ncbi:MAG: hypothetical protein FWD47_05245 [Treponema sp.]|nr:hypothetical protein [Treponema sp.]
MVKIEEKLDNINKTLEKMLDVMDKPEHNLIKALIIGGMIVSIFGIIGEIDTIIKWIKEFLW